MAEFREYETDEMRKRIRELEAEVERLHETLSLIATERWDCDCEPGDCDCAVRIAAKALAQTEGE